MARETVLEELVAGVLTITLNRPRQRNAFNLQMWDETRDALHEAQQNDHVRAVIVTGAEGAFTGGQDLGEMAKPPAGVGPDHGFPSFIDRLCRFDKPLLAAVNGVGVGIGLTLLLHCDVVYVAEGARLRAPFLPLGVVPEAGSTFLLPYVIGWQRAAELLFTAEWIEAPRAVELGLASRVCAPDELLPAIRARAAAIAAQPLGSLRHTKRLLLATRDDQVRAALEREHRAFALRVGSPENAEAIRAFFEKRTPDFTNVSPEDRLPRGAGSA
jgi:enoyl-CoA hydratase/carnithine racemase